MKNWKKAGMSGYVLSFSDLQKKNKNMNKDSVTSYKLGMFVVIGLALFVLTVYFVGKQKNLFGSTFQLKTQFKSVSGLKVGNNVRFSGINVGVIDDIEQITDSTVRVDMVINEQTRTFIKKNAKAIGGWLAVVDWNWEFGIR